MLNEQASHKVIGVLGGGFVGQYLLRHIAWHPDSYFTRRNKNSDSLVDLPYYQINFDIDQASTWDNLPKDSDVLLITFPPNHRDPENEQRRLTIWCEWMKKHRPKLNQVIYLSTTGVYAEQDQLFTENSECQPSHLRGELRWLSEQLLSEYFDCTVIRCAGIYGPERNMITKILDERPVMEGNKSVYRIHVEDLTNIITQIAIKSPKVKIFHGVDCQSVSQDEVLAWLKTQDIWRSMLAEKFRTHSQRLDQNSKKSEQGQRLISQEHVFNYLDYRLKYPIIYIGLTDILTKILDTK